MFEDQNHEKKYFATIGHFSFSQSVGSVLLCVTKNLLTDAVNVVHQLHCEGLPDMEATKGDLST